MIHSPDTTWRSLAQRIGHTGADLMIAANALARDARVVTGTVDAFLPSGARIENPF